MELPMIDHLKYQNFPAFHICYGLDSLILKLTKVKRTAG